MPNYSVVVRIEVEMEMEIEADTIEGAYDLAEDAGYDADCEGGSVVAVDVLEVNGNE